MEQNQEQFAVEKLSQKNLKLLYEQIVQTAVMTNTKTKAGRNAMTMAINDYIKYAGNKSGIFCTYSFRNDNRDLTSEEKEILKKTDSAVNFACARPEINHIEFSDFLLMPETLGDFAYYVSIIEHEFQHMVNNKEQNFYTDKNKFGLKMEFGSHHNALNYLLEFVKNNPADFDFADEVLLKTINRAIYFFDDNEVKARMTGLQAQQKFLESAGKVAKKFDVEHINADEIVRAVALDEQETNFKQLNILKETQKEIHSLLYKLQKFAVDKNNIKLAEALAETQDIKQLFNPLIYKNLDQFATQHNKPKLALMLDNSKYAPKLSTKKLKADIENYVDSEIDLSRQDAFYLLFNHDQANLAKMHNLHTPIITAPTKIVQTYEDDTLGLSEDGKAFVEKMRAKNTTQTTKKTHNIIVAKEIEDQNDLGVLVHGNTPIPETPAKPKERTYTTSKGGIILPQEVDPDKPRRKTPRAKKIVEAPLHTHPGHEVDTSALFEIEEKPTKEISARSLYGTESKVEKAKHATKNLLDNAKNWIDNNIYYDGKEK